MADTGNPIRVRLDPDVRERLDRFQVASRRNLTQSVNILLDAALRWVETAEGMDAIFGSPTPRKEH